MSCAPFPSWRRRPNIVSLSVGNGGEGAPARVAVLLPLPLERAYNYAVPDELASVIAPGAFVRVPLAGRERVGVVWGTKAGTISRLSASSRWRRCSRHRR